MVDHQETDVVNNSQPSQDTLVIPNSYSDNAGEGPSRTPSHHEMPGADRTVTWSASGENHLDHHRHHEEQEEPVTSQMTQLFILEFGIIFHSIFIGLTLAVAGDNFVILYIVLAFHQTFEGLGLGSRLATANWPKSKRWLPWALGAAFGFTTPIAIAIGLGIRESFAPDSPRTLIVQGVFDSVSAGILIYTGLVDLMAHEFMFNTQMKHAKISYLLLAFGCMCAGTGVMALLAKWA